MEEAIKAEKNLPAKQEKMSGFSFAKIKRALSKVLGRDK